MDDFIAAQIRSLERTASVRMPRPAQCLIVTKLAAHCVAAHAGIGLKDFLVTLDGQPAGGLMPEIYATPGRRAGEAHRKPPAARGAALARHILLLDGTRRVRYEGELDGVAFWNTLWAVNEGPGR